MSRGERSFRGTIGKTIADSKPWWPPAQKPPAGAPNILVVLFDDVGFSDFGCYGSPIKTPTIDRLAAEGLRYSGFHTTAMCSTTRAALLTGRNHHSVGVGCLANFDSGYPGYRGKIAREAGTLAEMLRPHAYRNYMVGKWHVTPLTESGATGPFDGWPLGRGFDRFYGFLDAETDQYAPELVSDNTHIDPPGTYADGYHLTWDLVDQAIRFIGDHIADRPDLPWLTWLAFGACHAPHQAPADIIKGYDPLFAHGWDVEREQRLERQKAMGLVPSDTKMPARNDGVKAWDEHGEDERRVFTRLQSAFAGMLDHADRHLARLIDFLESRRPARRYLDPGAVGQWREPGGRAARLHQCDGTVQFQAGADPGKAAPDRRHRRSGHPQQFPARLGDGLQYAAAPLQAEHPWRRHPRSPGDVVAEADRGEGRGAASIRARLRSGADLARPRRHRGPGHHRGLSAAVDRGRKFRAARSRTPRRRRNPRRNISRCSAIAGSGTTAGRRSPIIRRARRSRTTNGSCFISTAIFPKSTISRRKSRSGSPT